MNKKLEHSIIELIDERMKKGLSKENTIQYKEFLDSLKKKDAEQIVIQDDFGGRNRHTLWLSNISKPDVECLIKRYMAQTISSTRNVIEMEIGKIEYAVQKNIDKNLDNLTAEQITSIVKQLNDTQIKT